MKILICLISAAIFFLAANGNPVEKQLAPIVQLTTGKVQGVDLDVENGKKVHAYIGIRYGKADRFEKPKPVEPWSDIYDATSPKSACPQPLLNDTYGRQIQSGTISEDCLFLTIWKPAEQKPNRTVLFYLHGGAFVVGSIFAPVTDARYIASRGDVIVVTINYRLGIFGFLHGGSAPGNAALHDQLLALNFVKQNIAAFGGDPNQLVPIGSSTGSTSVGALILSPLAQGLFSRAILMGGVPNSQFGTISKEVALQQTQKFAAKLNCPGNIPEAVQCLRTKPMADLVAQTTLNFANNEFFLPIYGDSLLPINPKEALKAGKFNQEIDLLMGISADEGSYFVAQIFPKLLDPSSTNITAESTKEDIKYMVNNIFNQSIGEEVVRFYMRNVTVNPKVDELKSILSNVWGDYQTICPAVYFTKQLHAHRPGNQYFWYRNMERFSAMPGIQPWMGTIHGQDTMHIFAIPLQMEPNEKQIGKDFIAALISFAKSGNPGTVGAVSWEDAFDRSNNSSKIQHMEMQVGKYKMVADYFVKVCNEFWNAKI